MKNFIYILFLVSSAVIYSSCSVDELKGGPTSSEPQIKHAKVDTAFIANDTLSDNFSPRLDSWELLENFNYCHDNAENRLMCKYFIAKAICDYYGINDFKQEEIYIDYENIFDFVNKNEEWQKLGEANDQEVLEEAQILANRGKATIAIDTKSKYGHVVFLMKGNLSKAHNWNGLMAPTVASFFMVDGIKSFVNKSMGFAFSTPEGVYLYSKK